MIGTIIDFENVWLPQIVAYAQLIHTGQLEDEWLGRSNPTSSVTDPDELYEQIFDDLDADGIWPQARDIGSVSTTASNSIDSFLAALRDIESNEPAVVVASAAWAKAKDAADAVLASVG